MDEEKNDQEVQPEEETDQTSDEFDAKSEIESLKSQMDEKLSGLTDEIVGRLKRENKKEAKKSEKSDETNNKTDNTDLLERLDNLALGSKGIEDTDEIELAKDFQKRTGLTMDEVIKDDIFTERLGKLREDKANKAAVSNVKGGGGENNTKNTANYWQAKGTRPTREDIPDDRTRRKVIREMLEAEKPSKNMRFYNS